MPKHRPRPERARSVRRRTAAALAGGALVVLPTMTASGLPAPLAVQSPQGGGQPALAAPFFPPDIVLPPLAVDGSLPQPPVPQPLMVPGAQAGNGSSAPSGPLGIPGSMLKAYKNAADIMAKEQPGCHLDWALIAAIGRIESNHARGGYVDAKGNTLEPILGPVLNGAGAFAAIRDTDGGRYDGDRTWDRAVGAMQFIPSTWTGYASDGNGDGIADPNNIYDESLATARYLCSGGLDLSSDAMQRLAVRRYNNSQSYVDTVMSYAAAYRGGVSQLPDSQVPIGAPPGPGAVAAAAGSPAGDPAPPVTQPPPSSVPPSQLPPSSTTPTSSSPTSKPTTPTTPASPTSSTPTSDSPPPTTPATPASPTTTSSSGAPAASGSSSAPATTSTPAG